jgi:hypothetical protein
MNPHEAPKELLRSHLFTVRLWQEKIGGNEYEVRMQVRHVLSGEVRYFRTWPELARFLLRTLQDNEL